MSLRVSKNSRSIWDEVTTLCDDYLGGKILFVPMELVDRLENERMRVERKEATYLVWSIIKGRSFGKDRGDWWHIHSDHFKKVAGSDSTIKWAKQWLFDKGFIGWDRSYVPKSSASESNPAKSQAYQVRSCGGPIVKRLDNKNVVASLYRNSSKGNSIVAHSQYHLDCFEPDFEHLRQTLEFVLLCYNLGVDHRSPTALADLREKKRIEEKNQESWISKKVINQEAAPNLSWQNRDVQTFGLPLLKLINNKGVTKRGANVNRLFTPLTGLMREFRHGFSFMGDDWVNLDLTCSQPTLLAYECNDSRFIRDCQQNTFYDRVGDHLGSNRDEAKRGYCAFAYGRNRPKNSSNKIALKVQDFMRQEYPTAFEHVYENKEVDHTLFIRKMQNKEAAIFVDGIYAELISKKVPCLTIHDSILTTPKNEGIVRTAIKKYLDKEGIWQRVKSEVREKNI